LDGRVPHCRDFFAVVVFRRCQTTRSGSCLSAGAMRPRSCNALTVFRVADRDRVNFAVFESAQQFIAAQQFGLKLIAVLQVREQPVRFRSSRKAPQSTLVLCQVVTVCALLAIESGSSANLTLGLLHVCSSSTPDSELVRYFSMPTDLRKLRDLAMRYTAA
jgi:hypothetical protein